MTRTSVPQRVEAVGAPHLLRGLRAARLRLVRGVDGMQYRRDLATLVDHALTELFHHAAQHAGVDAATGVALAAVGSQGRRDAGPVSDLDLILVHDGRTHPLSRITTLAEALWYPIWDAGLDLDHSVRSLSECRSVASADLPAAVGLIDVRAVAGDETVLHEARAAVLHDWRLAARRRLPELVDSIRVRADRHGELAHMSEPDLKECRGGLRDAVVLDSLAASWLADRPHGQVDEAFTTLLDARDALSRVTGRQGARLLRVHQDEVASDLGRADADDLLAHLAHAGRLISFGLDTTLRHARQALRRPSAALGPRLVRGRLRPPQLRQVATDLVEHDGELTLASGARPQTDPELPLRAAAAAARTGLPLSPATLSSLAEAPAPALPWSAEARLHLTALLRSGRAQIAVWESLDLAGVVTTWLPEWAAVRNRPQRSPGHRYTVDRHLVQTVANACEAPDDLPERDVLLWAALLHGIGRARYTQDPRDTQDHGHASAGIARAILDRIGLDATPRERIVRLVRHHRLLSETATNADVHDPSVVAEVARLLGHDATDVILLRHLTEAGARAAGPTVWTPRHARLVDALATRVLAQLGVDR